MVSFPHSFSGNPKIDMNQTIRNLQTAFIIAFALTAAGLLYWQLFRADDLTARDDNPRRVIAEQRVKRGKIFAKNGVALAETITGADGLSVRRYPYPNLATVTGYYSVRYGTGGLEAAFDAQLRGETRQTRLDALMHHPSVGEAITVTIDLPAQVAADTGLAELNATGAVIALNAHTGALAVMASRPTFNPNRLDDDWDTLSTDPAAPLVNRATQGLFPLGELAARVQSVAAAENLTLADGVHQFYFDREIPFALPTAAGVIPAELPQKAGEIAVTPLHVALLTAALAGDGSVLPPMVVVLPAALEHTPLRLVSAETAAQWRSQFADAAALALPDVTGAEPLSWYVGIRGDMVIVAVVTSPEADRDAARTVAQTVFQSLAE